MSSTTRHTISIIPLGNADDYENWASKMEDILTDVELWDYVLGDKKDEPSDDLAAWKKNQRKALSAIRLRVGDGPLAYVRNASSAAAAWTKLESIYRPKGSISVIQLRRKLFRAQCLEGQDVEEHIREMTRIKESLAKFSKSDISENEFATCILTSLPNSWDNWISGIEFSDIKDSTSIIARILQQAGREAAKPDSDEVQPTVGLVARHQTPKFGNRQSSSFQNRSSYNANVICFACGRIGHIKPECKDTADGRTYTDEEKLQNSLQSKSQPTAYSHVAITDPYDDDEEISDFAF